MSLRLQTLSIVASRGMVAWWHSGIVAQIIGHDADGARLLLRNGGQIATVLLSK